MGMIKSDREYTVTKKKIKELSLAIRQLHQEMKEKQISSHLAQAAVAAQESFLLQLQEEVAEYDNLRTGRIPDYFWNVQNLGLLLIALRIARGYTQTELAQKLGVAPSQVCRDERNDYYGVSLPSVRKIMEALGVNLDVVKLKPDTFNR